MMDQCDVRTDQVKTKTSSNNETKYSYMREYVPR